MSNKYFASFLALVAAEGVRFRLAESVARSLGLAKEASTPEEILAHVDAASTSLAELMKRLGMPDIQPPPTLSKDL